MVDKPLYDRVHERLQTQKTKRMENFAAAKQSRYWDADQVTEPSTGKYKRHPAGKQMYVDAGNRIDFTDYLSGT